MSLDDPQPASPRAKVAIIIINYRTPRLVTACLDSFLAELDEGSTVVVVDNASEDGSVAELRAWGSVNDQRGLIRILEAPRNVGFAAGNNLGIRSIDAPYYLLLNSDTIMRKGVIGALVAIAEQYPKAGVISPRLEWPDGTPQESCFRDHTPISEFIDAAQTGPITRLLRRYVVPLAASSTLGRPNWASFACVLLRRRMLEEVGMLDERFFMYYEDAELCYRARRAGWDVVHDSAVRAVHLRGGSSSFDQLAQGKQRLPRYYYESRSHYFATLYGRSGLVLANLCWLFGRSVSKAREIVSAKPRQVPERQWLDIWTNCMTYLPARAPSKLSPQSDHRFAAVGTEASGSRNAEVPGSSSN